MPNMSNSAEIDFFKKVVPSKIFHVSNFAHVDVQHNRSIAALTDPLLLGYTTKIDQIVNVLSDSTIAQYQDRLLKKAVEEICADRVDIDHIRIGLKLTEQDLVSLLEPETGILNVKTKGRSLRLSVKEEDVDSFNRGFKKSDWKPFFTRKYQLCLFNDEYRFVHIYIAEPSHPKNVEKLRLIREEKEDEKWDFAYNCVIECIPTRLTQQHISLMLFHFKSTLKPNRYDQLVKHGLLLRLDTGYVMHGVSQLFAFATRKDQRISAYKCIPSKLYAVETAYIGDRKAKHIIIYDKVLKENKFFVQKVCKGKRIKFGKIAQDLPNIDEWFLSQVVSARIEFRDNVPKSPYLLADMEQCKSQISDVVLVRPSVIAQLPEDKLAKRVKNKKGSLVDFLIEKLQKMYGNDTSQYLFEFDKAAVDKAFDYQLSLLREIIFHPKPALDQPELVHHTNHVNEAAKLLDPYISLYRTKQDDPKQIVTCSHRAIYVEGSPGSGKTKLIVDRVQHLVDSGVEPKHICVLAFTRAAAEEFEQRLTDAGIMDPKMYVGTFSTWCKHQILKDKSSRPIGPEESANIFRSLLPTNGRLVSQVEKGELARLLVRVVSYKASFDKTNYSSVIDKKFKQLAPFKSKILRILKKFEKWKNENRIDFDDLLTKAREIVVHKSKATKLANRYQHIILDEVQDTNSVQWDIVERMYKAGSQLFCVGDPAQSMYEFRGANDKKLNRFNSVFKSSKVFQLIENYRSTPQIVDLANALRYRINSNYSPSVSKQSSGPRPRYKKSESFDSAVDWLIADFKKQIKARQMNNCLVLFRYNDPLKIVQERIRAEGLEGQFRFEMLTYHGGKGREAEHCYVFDPLFTYSRLSSKKEELCNTYVAMTRAKKYLTILASDRADAFYSSDGKGKLSPSIFSELRNEEADILTVLS
jgi:DNA helicase-2/ATP-dependent DNA helicase PcrA